MPSKDLADMARIAEYLANLSHPQLLEVLRRVFTVKRPYPTEISWNDSRYFLGIGGRTIEDDPDQPDASSWGAWQVSAVGYIDRDIYPNWDGESEFAQHGQCSGCGIEVSSSVWMARCPICTTRVHGT